mgnify:CR=1 FL=1
MIDKTIEKNEKIDAAILAVSGDEWTKVALVISKVFEADGFEDLHASAQNIADRIYILVDAGQLAVQGNMRRWRDGEVKLVVK